MKQDCHSPNKDGTIPFVLTNRGRLAIDGRTNAAVIKITSLIKTIMQNKQVHFTNEQAFRIATKILEEDVKVVNK